MTAAEVGALRDGGNPPAATGGRGGSGGGHSGVSTGAVATGAGGGTGTLVRGSAPGGAAGERLDVAVRGGAAGAGTAGTEVAGGDTVAVRGTLGAVAAGGGATGALATCAAVTMEGTGAAATGAGPDAGRLEVVLRAGPLAEGMPAAAAMGAGGAGCVRDGVRGTSVAAAAGGFGLEMGAAGGVGAGGKASRLYCGSVCSQVDGESPGGRLGERGGLCTPGEGTSGSSGARAAGRASSAGGSPRCTSRERRASTGVPEGGVGIRGADAAVGGAKGAAVLATGGAANGRGGVGKVGTARGGAGVPMPGDRAGGVSGTAGAVVLRDGWRLPAGGGAGGRGVCALGGKRELAAKGQVLPLVAGVGAGVACAGRSGARGAPVRIRSSGVCASGVAAGVAGGRGVEAGAPGRVKFRAAPGWLGATCAGGVAATGRVKPAGAWDVTGGVAAGGSSWKLPWPRAPLRLSRCKSRDSNAGGCAGTTASPSQVGQSPRSGSSAPHFRHLDTGGKHERRNEAPTQESGVSLFRDGEGRGFQAPGGRALQRAKDLMSGPSASSRPVLARGVAQLVTRTKARFFPGASHTLAVEKVLLPVCESTVPSAHARCG
jgi:hypothetical protein